MGFLQRFTATDTFLIVIAMAIGCGGCSDHRADALLGSWQTEIIDSEWGPHRITVTYLADGRVDGTSSFVSGEELVWHGTYRVRGNTIQRTVEGDTQEITYRVDGDTLHHKIGDEDYTFRRIT